MTCYLCNTDKQSFGFHIGDSYICDVCEHKIIESDVNSTEYNFYIERLKTIWYDLLNGEEHA